MLKERYFGQSSRIANWKRNTLLENLLAKLADYSEFWKHLYVLYYKLMDNAYYVGGVRMINKQLSIYDKQFVGVSRSYLIRDMVYCLHRFGISFEEYCIYYFIGRNTYSRSRFVSDNSFIKRF